MAESGRQACVQAAQAQGRRPTALQRASDLLRLATLLGLFLVLSSASRAGSDFYLKDGDTVVFYGDSITDRRLYTVFTETFAITRFPKLHLRFVHSGWAGDRVAGGFGGSIDVRLNRDVIAYKPTVVTILLGMNDAEYEPFDAARLQKFASGYEHIVRTLKSALPGVRITLLEPSTYDDITRPPGFEGGYNAVLRQYARVIRELARREKLAIADLNAPAISLLETAKKVDAELAPKLIPDRVHPSEGVHLLMAEALLKAWHAPAIVSAVEIDAAAATVTSAGNAEVNDIDASNGLAWTQTDAALPMPVEMSEETLALAVRNSDFSDALNRETLKITGLSPGKYSLEIDGSVIGTFKARRLTHGINLAALKTPMREQAEAVYGLALRHNHVHFARWRMIEDSFRDYKMSTVEPAAMALDAVELEALHLLRTTAQPKPRRYHLKKQ
jgi:lysophospholipase L1-like esterase